MELHLSEKSSLEHKYFKYCTFRVQNFFSLKDETQLAMQAYVIYHCECSYGKNQTYIGRAIKDIWKIGLGNIFQEIQQFFYICLTLTHVVIQ